MQSQFSIMMCENGDTKHCTQKFNQSIMLTFVWIFFLDYATQAEYHTDIAKTILKSNSVITASAKDVPLIYALSFEVYFLLGSAMMVTKKYGAAEKALGEAQRVYKLLEKQDQTDHRHLENMELQLEHALAKYVLISQCHGIINNGYTNVVFASSWFGSFLKAIVNLNTCIVFNKHYQYVIFTFFVYCRSL